MTAAPLCKKILAGAGKPQPGICTAAFSGGADSTALLMALFQLRDTLEIDLRAVHVHHGIRGAEADRDAQFCAQFCEKYGIPFQCVQVDVPAYAAEQKLSLETAARLLRYRALENAAPAGEIATAHHMGDNAETVLFHLLRGSGMKGLRGILPRSGRIIRPLLGAEKTEILTFLQENGQDFVEDSTNFTGESSRNRIRTELMPLLQKENPAALRHIAMTAELLAEDEDLLAQQADDAFAKCFFAKTGGFSGLSDFPRSIRMRVYMRALEKLQSVHIDPSFAQLRAIDAAILSGSGTVNLTKNVYARVHRGILYMQENAPEAETLPKPLQIGENRIFAGRLCIARLFEGGAVSQNIHTADTKATLDFDKIIGQPMFRARSAADKIRLPGRDFDSLLKKCIQAAIPRPERQTLHTLYDDAGCIWCEHVGVAARVKPNAESRRILTLAVSAT